MARYSYAFGTGWNTALGSLTNPENRSEFLVRGVYAAPISQPPNLFPVRLVTLGGKPKGFGRVDHVWFWSVLPLAAVDWIEDTFFTSGTVVPSQMTINTRVHNRDTYTRYNVWGQLWIPGDTLTYDRTMFRNVSLLFHGLTASS